MSEVLAAAASLRAEAAAAGVVMRLEAGGLALEAASEPSPELLARLRAHKAELVALLRGDACRHCARPMGWPDPRGVIYGDGTAEHHECRSWEPSP